MDILKEKQGKPEKSSLNVFLTSHYYCGTLAENHTKGKQEEAKEQLAEMLDSDEPSEEDEEKD